MKAIDTVRWVMRKADEWVSSGAGELRDAALVQPTPRGGNHPLWIVGHLALVEGMVPEVLFGEPNPVEHWKPLFDRGTTPTTDASVVGVVPRSKSGFQCSTGFGSPRRICGSIPSTNARWPTTHSG